MIPLKSSPVTQVVRKPRASGDDPDGFALRHCFLS